MRRKYRRNNILAWLLAAFFLFGAAGNIFISQSAAADYQRWGYPDWFHFVTGGLELLAALLIGTPRLRIWGATLASLIMAAAATTLIAHGEYSDALVPLIILALALLVARMAYRRRVP